MNTTTKPTPVAQAAIEECRKLFGEHPVDVIAPMGWAVDALLQVGAILSVIVKDADPRQTERCAQSRIRSLAKAAKYIADDMANTVDCRHGDFIYSLKQSGVEVSA